MKKDFTNKEYEKYVTEKMPKSPFKAFLVGGIICTIAQVITYFMKKYGVEEETVNLAIPVIMIFLGGLLTGVGLYSKLGKFAGAGSIVPITGFANSIVSPSMEFKTEGFITGLAVKIFSVAGPVVVFGTITSVIIGFVYWLLLNFF